MRGQTAKGKNSMGRFFGFKLHIVINEYGEVIQRTLTPGNTDDRKALKNKNFTQRLSENLFADRSYINQYLFEASVADDGHLATKIKKNRKDIPNSHLYKKIKEQMRIPALAPPLIYKI